MQMTRIAMIATSRTTPAMEPPMNKYVVGRETPPVGILCTAGEDKFKLIIVVVLIKSSQGSSFLHNKLMLASARHLKQNNADESL